MEAEREERMRGNERVCSQREDRQKPLSLLSELHIMTRTHSGPRIKIVSLF